MEWFHFILQIITIPMGELYMRQISVLFMAGGLLTFLGLACLGCATDCTMELVPSVDVVVVDEAGRVVHDDALVVEYLHPSWSETWRACERWTSEGSWRCGDELAGKLRVRAHLADKSGQTDVIVKEDQCHVHTQYTDILLQ